MDAIQTQFVDPVVNSACSCSCFLTIVHTILVLDQAMTFLTNADILLQRNWSLIVHLVAVGMPLEIYVYHRNHDLTSSVYLCYSSPRLVIPMYDYILTLALEVEHFWQSTPGFGSIFFYLNRYFTILGVLPSSLPLFWPEALIHNNT
ncbi:hypothetical protein GYMLUDRAFT_62577 [Collybiopsis luxurians FD-317 M1]|uniref:Unplaced genomic scaffold GYMLUscaffold_58, whole genome shotgun sequence n=1 Tax=Collybiopsis luxurians FD-317 M1 TaxID=944289 RepID=A0A0D0BZT8_9AGAR|nr:hypothetical protein GYMLUDRAFT_62577 [Collybiopsis luxurians FD-317 M1]